MWLASECSQEEEESGFYYAVVSTVLVTDGAGAGTVALHLPVVSDLLT